ncbi:MAG: ABC transporter, partial [Burkholderiaceae bacterium]|nr:ABC transporter [Burkholderiaceae bacterium]
MQHSHSSQVLTPGLPAAMNSDAVPLESDENALASLPVDLTPTLHFSESQLVLTDRRLLALQQQPDAIRSTWTSWRLDDPDAGRLHLRHSDHGGVGTLALHDDRGRLAVWRFTLAQNVYAMRLATLFEMQQRQRSASGGLAAADPSADEPALCPSCKAPLPPDNDDCPVCSREVQTVPSTWVLLRLWRFARPYRKPLAAGFALTLASTAATLVPPYLAIPLMDDILIPFQNGQQIDPMHVALYLGGLLLAAVLAWGLGWARTYLLALVSERIGADLRTATFEHLLQLSLDYFGGKRTGDLMARIGSETDRICVFLSLHALDFATDVLMIVMTAVILFSINPWLAVVTLLPLPFIGWMIHTVRDRLRTGFEKIDRVWSEVTNVLADTIPGIRVVKAFAQEGREAQRFKVANQSNLQVNDRLNKTWSLFT